MFVIRKPVLFSTCWLKQNIIKKFYTMQEFQDSTTSGSKTKHKTLLTLFSFDFDCVLPMYLGQIVKTLSNHPYCFDSIVIGQYPLSGSMDFNYCNGTESEITVETQGKNLSSRGRGCM